jgi:hypothetical protein
MEDETRGLAKIAGAQKAPGMYNTTSRQLMINDLLARASAEVAKAQAPTVTTTVEPEKVQTTEKTPETVVKTSTPTKQTTKTPGLTSNLGQIAGIAALGYGGKKLYDLLGGSELMSEIAGPGTLLGGYSVAAREAAAMPMGMSMASDLNYVGADWSPVAAISNDVAFPLYDGFGDIAPAVPQVESYIAPATEAFDTITGSVSEAGSGFLDTAVGDLGFSVGEALPYVPAISSVLEGDVAEGAAQAGLAYVSPWLAAADALTGGAISEPISDVVSSAGSFVEDAVEDVGGFVSDFFDSCFITTACCKLYNKPDDCHELQTMRMFRDEFVAPNYPEAVNEYYAIAPGIVAAIEAREDANVIWADLYRHYIVPAVEFAQDKMYTQAYEIYTNMVNSAKEYANG